MPNISELAGYTGTNTLGRVFNPVPLGLTAATSSEYVTPPQNHHQQVNYHGQGAGVRSSFNPDPNGAVGTTAPALPTSGVLRPTSVPGLAPGKGELILCILNDFSEILVIRILFYGNLSDFEKHILWTPWDLHFRNSRLLETVFVAIYDEACARAMQASRVMGALS